MTDPKAQLRRLESKAIELTINSKSGLTYKVIKDVYHKWQTGEKTYEIHVYDDNDDYVGPWKEQQ